MRPQACITLGVLALAALWSCGSSDKKPGRLLPPIAGAGGDGLETPNAGDEPADTSAGAPSRMSEGGVAGVSTGDGGGGGLGAGGELGGAGGDAGFPLPAECPGSILDYTSIVFGLDADDSFSEDNLDGEVLILGGPGDDWFPPSPPGAADCLLGGDGNDRFETTFQSAPSVFVGGPGDDAFVLRGSLDTDTGYISDFKADGADRIILDAMAYGLVVAADVDTILPEQFAVVQGFVGGNSTAASGVRILYNPDDGGIWYDSDEDGTVAEAVRIGVIQNFASYTFAIEDWGLE